MAQGLQIWGENGQLLLDTSTFSGRFLGSVNLGAGPGSGTIYHDGFYSGTPFAVPQIDLVASPGLMDINLFWTAPSVSFNGNSLTWTRPPAWSNYSQYPNCVLHYGVR
jgi:hypothetical protein